MDDHADLGRPVHFEAAEQTPVRGDALLLKQLFINPITQAVTYGCEARVRVDRRGAHAVVTVADRGPGMSNKDLARAFEPFYRALRQPEPADRWRRLDLAIVLGAARTHGGEVRLSNGSEGGLDFEVELPLA